LPGIVGIAWDGPEPDPAGRGPGGRNVLLINAIEGVHGKFGSDNPQMIYPEDSRATIARHTRLPNLLRRLGCRGVETQ